MIAAPTAQRMLAELVGRGLGIGGRVMSWGQWQTGQQRPPPQQARGRYRQTISSALAIPILDPIITSVIPAFSSASAHSDRRTAKTQ
jgi:hypothetical protein